MLIIDRIEEGIALCEGENGERVSLAVFPFGAKEGDVLTQTDSGWQVDAAETEKRRQQALSYTRRIRNRRER